MKPSENWVLGGCSTPPTPQNLGASPSIPKEPSSLRLAGVLVGDVANDPGARTKYGLLFDALARRFHLVDVYDATLKGPDRWINALFAFHPHPHRWRERFYKNVPAFVTRSRRAAAYLRALDRQVDVVLQVGVLLDSLGGGGLPGVVYTDYTASLSARKPSAGRSEFSRRELSRWLSLEKQVYHRAAFVCPRSELVAKSLIDDYSVSPDRVVVVGGGVNFASLPEASPRSVGPGPVVLFIGKEFHRKGGDLLLKAFARVRQSIPHARLRMVTAGPVPSGLLHEGVEIIAPTWDRKVITALYQDADLFVLPSRLETWGDVLLEAMVHEIPCVGTNSDAMDEIIVSEQTGLIVPPEDVDALGAAMTRLLTDPGLRSRLGRVARQRVVDRFTWERVVDMLAPVLSKAATQCVLLPSQRQK